MCACGVVCVCVCVCVCLCVYVRASARGKFDNIVKIVIFLHFCYFVASAGETSGTNPVV